MVLRCDVPQPVIAAVNGARRARELNVLLAGGHSAFQPEEATSADFAKVGLFPDTADVYFLAEAGGPFEGGGDVLYGRHDDAQTACG